MGENADDMLEGRACSHCGVLFVRTGAGDSLYTHGYPVLCKTCYADCPKKHRAGLQPAADGVDVM